MKNKSQAFYRALAAQLPMTLAFTYVSSSFTTSNIKHIRNLGRWMGT